MTQNIDAINKNKFDYIKLKIFKGGKKPTISESKHTQLTGKKYLQLLLKTIYKELLEIKKKTNSTVGQCIKFKIQFT